MAFDGIVTKQVIKELDNLLIGGKINKVYQPNKNEVLFGIYANGKNYTLLVNIDSNQCRIHLTNFQKRNPLNAPNFCMLLRKHLIGMKIKSFETYGLERIVKIVLEGYDELNDLSTKEIVVELMGKHSNMILLNSSNTIIDSMRHLEISSNSTRDIMPARKYVFPSNEKQDIIKLTSFSEFYNIIRPYIGNEPIDTLISSKFIGISKALIFHIVDANNISNTSTLEEDYHIIYDDLNKLTTSNLTCITTSNKDYIIQYTNDAISPIQVNLFLDEFYHTKELSEEFISYRNSVLKLILNELKKYTKRLENMNDKLEECNKKEQYRIYGELITVNLYQIDENNNLTSIVLPNYYANNEDITIPLDKSISPHMNAKKYFKKYTKLKNACEIVSKQKQETKEEINYIESIVYELENAKTVSDIDYIYTEFSENFLGKNVSISTKNMKKNNVKKKKEEDFSPIKVIIDGYEVLVRKKQ